MDDVVANTSIAQAIGQGPTLEPQAELSIDMRSSQSAPAAAKPTTPRVTPANRPIRARASLPPRPTRSSAVPPKDIDQIRQKLTPEGIAQRKDEIIKEKEEAIRTLVDSHDTAVREKFHLERYISLLEGWDPVQFKQDQSPVFLDYKRQNHNLLDHIPHATPVAGPSRRRSLAPARTTRRQAHEQSEIFAAPVSVSAPTTPVTGKGKGKEKAEEPVPEPVKGKGKSRASINIEEPVGTGRSKSRMSVAQSPSTEMPPPPLPAKKGRGRRATMGVVEVEPEQTTEEEIIVEPREKGKKRGRLSLPNPPTKKRKGVLADKDPESPAVDSPAEPPEPGPLEPLEPDRAVTPPPPPAPRPSLAHIPFPPPPVRPKERVYGPKRHWYTDPNQKPSQLPKHNGQLHPILDSYVLIEDTGPPADPNALHIRSLNEAYYRNRVNYLQHQGRLSRLLEDDTVATSSKTKLPALPPRQVDFRDSLMSHMTQVRNAMMNESKSKPVVCKRVARMVMAYWEHIEGKEERERAAEERDRKKRAKDLVRAIRKRWALAVKIVRARMLEAQKAEQDRLGKEHLQNMLQRSTGLLDAQRDDLLGQTPGEESDSHSDGTDEVSAAEDSEAEDDEEESGESSGEDSEEGDEADADGGSDEDEDEDGTSDEASESDVEDRMGIAALLDEDTILEPADEPVDDAAETPTPGDDAARQDPTTNGVADARAVSTQTMVEAVASLPEKPEGRDDTDKSTVTDPTAEDTGDSRADALTNEEAAAKATPGSESSTAVRLEMDNSIAPESDIAPPNGHAEVTSPANSHGQTSGPPDTSPIPASSPRPSRPRRSRTTRSVSITTHSEDPDANDVEFKDENEELEDEDRDLDVEMEEEEEEGVANGDGGDSEDEGLLRDAEIPIEELMRRYGYPVPGEEVVEDEVKVGEVVDVGVAAVEGTVLEAVNGDAEDLATKVVSDVATDKSLLDESLHDPSSPLIIDGKRTRRVRSVWTPEDNPPPPPKKPKIEEVVESDREMTPELSSSEGETDEAEEVGELDDATDANKVRPPFLLRGTLRPYQQAGLEWLASLYANRMNGILADEMGLGKTIQTISLLGHLACDKGVWGQHLIIVPTSVILNWEMEFKKFLPGLKVLTYYGNQKERKEKRKGWHTENTWQVCITSYQIVLADQHIFRRKSWVYMILDEAHNIKNFRSQRWQTLLGFKAARRLLLTGTPLQNNLMELWSLLYFLMPNGVTADATAVVGFANHKEFSEWFSNPMDKAVESGDTMDEETMETVTKLHTLLRPFILRRLKSEVETQLPGKFEHVVYCKLSKRQRFLYDEFMSRSSTKEALTSGGYLGVVNTLMQLRKVCNHPDLFEVRPVKTSFAMDRSVLGDYEPKEIIVRKRLLAAEEELGLEGLNLVVRGREDESAWACESRSRLDASGLLPYAVEAVATTTTARGRKAGGKASKGSKARLLPNTPDVPPVDTRTIEGWTAYRRHAEEQRSIARWRSLRDINRLRCAVKPVYGSTLLRMLGGLPNTLLPGDLVTRTKADMIDQFVPPCAPLIRSYADRAHQLGPLIDYYAVQPPNAVARDLAQYALPGLTPSSHPSLMSPDFDTLHRATVKLQIAFPDVSLLQYDCGKLQKLAEMMRELKPAGHRVLIFTQMTRVLDILEMFLSYNGHRYLRLDGSTKIEDRQIITERFNSDPRIFCFIASSRSGGVGINLTGADTVFFYDSDWNPSMDRQCMDRAHRIGQTREVHIYRFVSIHTVEENMLKKANQKRLLDRVIIQEGDFTTDFFGKMDWRDLIDADAAGGGAPKVTGEEVEERVEDVLVEDGPEAVDVEAVQPRAGEERELARAFAEVEDEEDAEAARVAQGEGELDFDEFVEGKRAAQAVVDKQKKGRVGFVAEGSGTPMMVDGGDPGGSEGAMEVGTGERDEQEQEEEEEEDDVGAVDEYMLKWVEEDWDWFVHY